MKKLVISTFVLFALLISSCQKENSYQCLCTEGSGNWATTYTAGVTAKNREAAIEKCENLRQINIVNIIKGIKA